MTKKNVQIPYELFLDLVRYHLAGMEEVGERIQKGLWKKMASLSERELYSQYKTAHTDEERESARIEYLNRRGVSESFRW